MMEIKEYNIRAHGHSMVERILNKRKVRGVEKYLV